MNLPNDPVWPSPSAEDVSKASSELNNLLQIISGTSALIENDPEGGDGSQKYLAMLRSSIERAEKVAADLAIQAGCTRHKMVVHPELEGFVRSKTGPQNGSSIKPAILLVDDEQMALTLVKRILSEAGFQVTTAQSGFECIDLYRRRPQGYDLVLLDLTMPFMTGEETFHRLRELSPDVPVVLCTGFIQQERLTRLMAEGLAGFLRKPIAPDEIVGLVRSTLANVKYARGSLSFQGAPIVA